MFVASSGFFWVGLKSPGGSPRALERPARFAFFSSEKTKMFTENGWLEDEDVLLGRPDFGRRVYLVFTLV